MWSAAAVLAFHFPNSFLIIVNIAGALYLHTIIYVIRDATVGSKLIVISEVAGLSSERSTPMHLLFIISPWICNDIKNDFLGT